MKRATVFVVAFLAFGGAAKYSRAGVPEELLREKRVLEARMEWLRERMP